MPCRGIAGPPACYLSAEWSTSWSLLENPFLDPWARRDHRGKHRFVPERNSIYPPSEQLSLLNPGWNGSWLPTSWPGSIQAWSVDSGLNLRFLTSLELSFFSSGEETRAVPKSLGRWGGEACGSVKVRCLAAHRAQGLLQSYFFFFFFFLVHDFPLRIFLAVGNRLYSAKVNIQRKSLLSKV